MDSEHLVPFRLLTQRTIRDNIVIKPKKLPDADDVLHLKEAEAVARGEKELESGRSTS